MNNQTKNLIAIHFSAYTLTNFGQNVYITGNCPQLGLWQPKNGIKLQTNLKEYPIWYSKKPIVLQKLINLQYKICILDQNSNIIRWENIKNNRTLSLKTSCSIFLTQGQPEVQYNFDNQDSNSTQFNSTKKTALSDIQEQENEDQPHDSHYNDLDKLDKKKYGSSTDRCSPQQLQDLSQQLDQKIFSHSIVLDEYDHQQSQSKFSI